jgi:recombinational DNA repair protein (RecF pathway)
MAHQIYHTQAFVLRKVNASEWDCRYLLFTKRFGLIWVTVKSARKPLSKLRGHFTLFSQVDISLVRGKEVWRVVGVANTGLNADVSKNSASRLVLAQLFNLVKRLIKGEQSHPELFDELEEICQSVKTYKDDEMVLEKTELIAVLRILHLLGYIPDIPELRVFITDFDWKKINEGHLSSVKSALIKTINQSLQETHL